MLVLRFGRQGGSCVSRSVRPLVTLAATSCRASEGRLVAVLGRTIHALACTSSGDARKIVHPSQASAIACAQRGDKGTLNMEELRQLAEILRIWRAMTPSQQAVALQSLDRLGSSGTTEERLAAHPGGHASKSSGVRDPAGLCGDL